jgi:hypothetical protein
LFQRLKSLASLPDARKQELLAIRSALLEESARLKLVASRLASQRSFRVSVVLPSSALTYTLEHTLSRVFRLQRKTESLRTLLARIECDTFYWELALWFLVPGANSEDILGDLIEEYLLRASTQGEPEAKVWYARQIVATAKDYLWEKIERLTALGTLLDLVVRWFRG